MGGRFTKFDIPGAITTAPYEINNRGQIVGNYGDAAGAEHGFVLRRGVVTTIDHPGATASPALTGTRVVGIDDRGRLVGSYGDDAGNDPRLEVGERQVHDDPPAGRSAFRGQRDQQPRPDRGPLRRRVTQAPQLHARARR